MLEVRPQAPVLPDAIYSPEQLQACSMEIDRLISWQRRQAIKRQSGVAVSAVPDWPCSPDLRQLLGSPNEILRLAPAQLEAWQEQIQLWIQQGTVHLTFAAPPPMATRMAIVRWFRTEIRPNCLLHFAVNRTIDGGMVIRTPNRVFDFSFRRQILQHKERLPELLKSV